MSGRWVRRAAAAIVLLAACAVCVRLAPVYWGAWRFRQYVAAVARDPDARRQPEDWIRARLVNQAAELGLPVRSDQVRIHRMADRFELEVRYVAPVTFAFYSVDLHFRPRARGH